MIFVRVMLPGQPFVFSQLSQTFEINKLYLIGGCRINEEHDIVEILVLSNIFCFVLAT